METFSTQVDELYEVEKNLLIASCTLNTKTHFSNYIVCVTEIRFIWRRSFLPKQSMFSFVITEQKYLHAD